MSYWLIPAPVRMSIFMNLINFHYAISPKHFTNSYNEATGMYACACMFAHLYCLEIRVEITVIESASTVGSVKLLLCHLAFPSIILNH